MKLKLTYLREGNEAVDVAVTAEATTSLAELASALRAADPARPSGPSRQEPATLRLHMDDPSGPRHEVLNPSERLIESSLASGATISIAPASGFEQASRRGDVAATVTVIDGPDRGKTFELARGSSSLGRDSANRIVLSDALVSKTHARINVSDHLEIMDAGSANGTLVNDVAVDRAFLADGDRITVGDTVLSVRWTAATQAVFDEGVVFFNRPPRLDPQYEGRQLTAPEPPEKPRGQRLPYLALLAPLVMGGVILLIDPSNLFSLVFIALSPVLLLAGWIDGIVQSRREWKRAASQFNESVESIRSEIVRLHDEERAGRRRETPSVAEVVDAGRARNGVLWTRRPEHEAFLTLRLGEGRVPSRHELEMPSQRKGPAQLWAQLEELRDEIAFVADTPATENLREAGSIGVCGPSDTARAVARGIVAQLIGLHSPAELALVALSSTASSVSWDWLKWLPHVGSPLSPLSSPPLATGGPAATALIAALEELIATRSEAKTSAGEPTVLPTVVLLVEDDAPVERARLVGLAENGPDVGVHLIWVAPSLDRVPAACRTFVDVRATAGDSAAGFVRTGIGVQPVTVEPLGADDARRLARSLSPVVDAGARVDDASDVPSSVSLLHLIGPDLAQQSSAVLERWHETNSILTGPLASATPGKIRPNLRAVFGQAATEPFALDLRTDGPHALVGGTTGSGKSEFLQAWVLALAAAHSPQRVSFLFVDYKGGAAFADCVDLPHSVGLVTDLSPHLVRRALTSLRAELRYREHLFNRKKVKDIVEFERTGDPDVPPSLVIVVDEFAALATEVPEFVDGVVDVAQRGRSLGLHLVLATQRPAGVIRDNLRANTNLRVALRMADEADSTDVLGTPAAAQFDPSLPGRGAAKTGPGRIRVFQSGYAGGWTSDEPEPADIQIEELAYGGGRVWEAPADPDAEARAARVSSGPTDIKRIVSTVRSAAGEAQLPAPRKPWLPELATTYDFSKLPNPRTDAELLLGVVDDAASQSQPTVSYLPDRDGNMAIIGTGGAGKSTALRTIAVASAVTVRGGPVHVYGLDFGSGGLQMLQPLPHVGAVISGDDEERVARLLRWLRDLVDDRAVRFAEARAGSIVEYRKISGRADEPRILLLLDGMGAFRDMYESSISSPWFAVFSQIATDGRQVGVHVVVTGDRAGAIPTSLSSSIQRRLVLRLASADDYAMLGVESDVLDAASPAGRGILDGQEAQVAVLGGDSNVAVQARELEALAEAMRKAGIREAPPVKRLPEQVPLAELDAAGDSKVPLGIADDTLASVGIDPTGSFIVAGPPGAGRTTALLTLAASLRATRAGTELHLLSARRTPLARSGVWTSVSQDVDSVVTHVSGLVDRLNAGKLPAAGVAVFIENLADFSASAAEYELEGLVKSLIKHEQFVVAEAETSTWSQAYTLGQPLRAGRRGLVLQPDEGDGDLLFSTPLGRIRRRDFGVGRGFLIAQGRARKVQAAFVGDAT